MSTAHRQKTEDECAFHGAHSLHEKFQHRKFADAAEQYGWIFSCAIGINTKAFAGVIGVGGRLVEHTPPAKFSFAHYGFAGDSDFNNREMRVIDEMLEREGKTHRFQQFAGEHQWDEFEERFLNDVQRRSAADFRVAELQRRAKRDGAEGATARRLLGEANRLRKRSPPVSTIGSNSWPTKTSHRSAAKRGSRRCWPRVRNSYSA